MMWVIVIMGQVFAVQNFLDFCRENDQYASMINELNRIRRVLLSAINPPAWRDVFPYIWFGLKVVFFSAGDVPAAGPVVCVRRFVRGYLSVKEAPPYET